MGHIFGAQHDGNSGLSASCSPYTDYIMATGGDYAKGFLFSSCSINSFKAALLNTNLKYNAI